MNGKLAAALDLKTLAGRTHLYGLGPIEQLRGEATIADSRPALARVAPDGTVNVTDSFDAGVPFFVWAEVLHWVKMPIPERVRSFEDLERFVPQAAQAAGLDAAILGREPPPGITPITDPKIRASFAELFARTRMGWQINEIANADSKPFVYVANKTDAKL